MVSFLNNPHATNYFASVCYFLALWFDLTDFYLWGIFIGFFFNSFGLITFTDYLTTFSWTGRTIFFGDFIFKGFSIFLLIIIELFGGAWDFFIEGIISLRSDFFDFSWEMRFYVCGCGFTISFLIMGLIWILCFWIGLDLASGTISGFFILGLITGFIFTTSFLTTTGYFTTFFYIFGFKTTLGTSFLTSFFMITFLGDLGGGLFSTFLTLGFITYFFSFLMIGGIIIFFSFLITGGIIFFFS